MIEAAVAIVQGERGLAAVFKVVAVAVGQLEGDAARVRALVGDLSNEPNLIGLCVQGILVITNILELLNFEN